MRRRAFLAKVAATAACVPLVSTDGQATAVLPGQVGPTRWGKVDVAKWTMLKHARGIYLRVFYQDADVTDRCRLFDDDFGYAELYKLNAQGQRCRAEWHPGQVWPVRAGGWMPVIETVSPIRVVAEYRPPERRA